LTLGKSSELNALKLSLLQLAKEIDPSTFEYDWIKIRDLDFQQAYQEKQSLLQTLKTHQAFNCPNLVLHYSMIHQQRMLSEQIQQIESNLSDMNLDLLPDYKQRIQVLSTLEFIDSQSIVQVKGRVACEINTANELILTELIFENFLNEFEPSEIVALLSCFVFQEKSDYIPVLLPKLEKVFFD
jgi:antiviral helicase SKI2